MVSVRPDHLPFGSGCGMTVALVKGGGHGEERESEVGEGAGALGADRRGEPRRHACLSADREARRTATGRRKAEG